MCAVCTQPIVGCDTFCFSCMRREVWHARLFDSIIPHLLQSLYVHKYNDIIMYNLQHGKCLVQYTVSSESQCEV